MSATAGCLMPEQIEIPLLERMKEGLDGVTIHRLSKRIASIEQPRLHQVILGFSGTNSIDAVAIETLEVLIEHMSSQETSVHIAGMKGPVRDVVKKTSWPEKVGPASDFSSILLNRGRARVYGAVEA